MQRPKNPYIHYNTPPKTHVIAKIAFALIAVLIVVAVIALIKDKRHDTSPEKVSGMSVENGPLVVNKGEAIQTRFFEVIVERTSVAGKIPVISQPGDIPKEKNMRYVTVEVIFKNLDEESKLMPAGELQIQGKSETVKYDKSETILKEGWGELMDNIAAGATMKTKLVYKIPAGITGKVYYYPEILYSKDRVFLMDL